jgi:hypothetical protein
MAASRDIWRATSYGYTPCYWLTVAGIPVVWTERALDLTLPTGFDDAEAAGLVIDDSGPIGTEQVDRDRGIGTGLPLAFTLLDSVALSTWMNKWSLYAKLTAQLDWNDTTAAVDSTTGWPATGYLYIGQERIYYGGKTTTSFTSLSRAQSGTLAQTHQLGTTAQNVTDLPRFWSGRDVCLYCTMLDPAGQPCGTVLADQSIMLWRGRIDGRAVRRTDGFSFEAISLDRIIDQPLPEALTGTIVQTVDYWPVSTGLKVGIWLQAYTSSSNIHWTYWTTLTPFAAYAEGELLSPTDTRQAISDAWSAWVTAESLTGTFDDLLWVKVSEKGAGKYTAWIQIDTDAAVKEIQAVCLFGDAFYSYDYPTALGGYDGDRYIATLVVTDRFGVAAPTSYSGVKSVTIQLDDGDPASVASSGSIILEQADKQDQYTYSGATVSGGLLVLTGLYNVGITIDTLQIVPVAGVNVSLSAITAHNSWAQSALEVLQSSGTGDRGTYDTLGRTAGYGLPDDLMDENSFGNGIGAKELAFLPLLSVSGASLPDLIGGALALLRRAIVAQPDVATNGQPVKLRIVDCGPGTDGTVTITDADLLAHKGDPVVSVQRADAPNSITIECGQKPLIYNDPNSQEAIGLSDVTWKIETTDVNALAEYAVYAAAGIFAFDQTAQAVELTVHPGVRAEVGDAVWLDLTHPALWSYTDGATGYTGPGRVVGRTLDLASCAVTLRLLIDGGTRVFSLSPSAAVVTWSPSATAPTTIDLHRDYLTHMQAALESATPVRLTHYRPGQTETAGQYHTYTGVTDTGTACRLTGVTTTGGHTLTANQSRLTLPVTASSNTYQKRFTHAADGSNWG